MPRDRGRARLSILHEFLDLPALSQALTFAFDLSLR
jgi:hypothetical protein